jgi:predicted nucleic acid-binding protein
VSAGIDTTWLIEVSLGAHPGHRAARATLKQIVEAAETLALAPQVLNEFVHAVTDGRRFENPLSMNDAVEVAEGWWNADLVWQVFPTRESVRLGFQWMRQYGLGRKRVLDTQLAATFYTHGITRILTSNSRDYRVFGCFELGYANTSDKTEM